jgi:hypothetical protein
MFLKLMDRYIKQVSIFGISMFAFDLADQSFDFFDTNRWRGNVVVRVRPAFTVFALAMSICAFGPHIFDDSDWMDFTSEYDKNVRKAWFLVTVVFYGALLLWDIRIFRANVRRRSESTSNPFPSRKSNETLDTTGRDQLEVHPEPDPNTILTMNRERSSVNLAADIARLEKHRHTLELAGLPTNNIQEVQYRTVKLQLEMAKIDLIARLLDCPNEVQMLREQGAVNFRIDVGHLIFHM